MPRLMCPPEKLPGAWQPLPLFTCSTRTTWSLFCRGVAHAERTCVSGGHLLAVATGKKAAAWTKCCISVDFARHVRRLLHGRPDGWQAPPADAAGADGRVRRAARKRLLMIGDTTHDLQMALNAGCASVGQLRRPRAGCFSMSSTIVCLRIQWRKVAMAGCWKRPGAMGSAIFFECKGRRRSSL